MYRLGGCNSKLATPSCYIKLMWAWLKRYGKIILIMILALGFYAAVLAGMIARR